MPVSGTSIRTLYDSYRNGGYHHEGTGYGGTRGFLAQVREEVGLEFDRSAGEMRLRRREDGSIDRRMRPEEFPWRELAEGIIGEDWREQMDVQQSGRDPLAMAREFDILEDNSALAIMPGQFVNVSVWNATIAGLLEAKVLEGYSRPAFMYPSIARTVPTRMRRDKHIGVGAVPDLAEVMQPGQTHPRAQFDERWILTPETIKVGLAIDVTKEAVFFDATAGQVMKKAESIGESLGLRREKRACNLLLGTTTGSTGVHAYTYKGTAYNFYIQSGGNWVNKLPSNPLVDWMDIDAAEQLFAEMLDMESGEPINIGARQLIVMPAKLRNAQLILGYNTLERRTQSAAEIGSGPNTVTPGIQLLTPSQWLYREALTNKASIHDGNGSNYSGASAANIREWWWIGDFHQAFGYSENWAMSAKRASPDNYAALDRNLVMSLFVDEMGEFFVEEPRAVVSNTH